MTRSQNRSKSRTRRPNDTPGKATKEAANDSAETERPVPSKFRSSWLIGAGLALAVFLVYLPSARFEFIYDDHEVITAQRAPRNLRDVAQLFAERHFYNLPYYRPITRTTLLVQKSLHGENPAPFHLFNAALMSMNAALAFALLLRPQFGFVRRARGPDDSPVGGNGDAEPSGGGMFWALFGAALFALHPVASSCVYPVASGRETAMPAFWMLLATLLWLRGGRGATAAAWGLFACALLSKEQAVVLPAVFLAADLTGLSGTTGPPSANPAASRTAGAARPLLLRYLPGVVLCLVYFMIRSALFGGSEFKSGGALGPVLSLIYAIRALLVPSVGLIYEPEFPIGFSMPQVVVAFALGAAIIVVFLRLVPGARGLGLFWGAWFVLVQLPTANIVEQEAKFDERYLFLGSLGLWFTVAAAARALHGRVGTESAKRGLIVAASVLVVCCAAISVGRGASFKNDLSFHSRWFETNPGSVNANVHLGRLLGEQGRYEESMRHFRRALERFPDYPQAHGCLAVALKRQGRMEDALAHGRRALELKPDYAEAWFNHGAMLAETGAFAEATVCFERTIEFQPANAEALYNLGNMRRRAGRTDEAAALYVRALAAKPDFVEARFNLANALADAGDAEGSIRELEVLLRARPEFVQGWINLGAARATRGDLRGAAECFAEALRLEPDNATAAENLARARASGGGTTGAER